MGCGPPGSSVHGILSRQESWNGLPCPPPGDLPDPGIEAASLHWRQILYCWASREALLFLLLPSLLLPCSSCLLSFSPSSSGILLGTEPRLFINIISLIYFILAVLVFVAVHGLFLVVARGCYSSLQWAAFSLQWLLLLQNTDSGYMGFSSFIAQAQ